MLCRLFDRGLQPSRIVRCLRSSAWLPAATESPVRGQRHRNSDKDTTAPGIQHTHCHAGAEPADVHCQPYRYANAYANAYPHTHDHAHSHPNAYAEPHSYAVAHCDPFAHAAFPFRCVAAPPAPDHHTPLCPAR